MIAKSPLSLSAPLTALSGGCRCRRTKLTRTRYTQFPREVAPRARQPRGPTPRPRHHLLRRSPPLDAAHGQRNQPAQRSADRGSLVRWCADRRPQSRALMISRLPAHGDTDHAFRASAKARFSGTSDRWNQTRVSRASPSRSERTRRAVRTGPIKRRSLTGSQPLCAALCSSVQLCAWHLHGAEEPAKRRMRTWHWVIVCQWADGQRASDFALLRPTSPGPPTTLCKVRHKISLFWGVLVPGFSPEIDDLVLFLCDEPKIRSAARPFGTHLVTNPSWGPCGGDSDLVKHRNRFRGIQRSL